MATKLFDNIELNEGEKEFVQNVLKDEYNVEVGSLYMQRAQALAMLRLAKEIEVSTKSNNKSASAMNLLTGGLVFVGVCQVVVAIVNVLFTK